MLMVRKGIIRVPVDPGTMSAWPSPHSSRSNTCSTSGPDGKPVAEAPPQAFRDAAALVPLFKQMLYVRTFDAKAIALQRTGKLGTYASCLGHEATHVGIGAAMPRMSSRRAASTARSSCAA